MELRFDQFGREEFQFLSRSCSIFPSTEALLLCESAGDAAREEEEEVIESYRGRDPTKGRIESPMVRRRSEITEGVGDGEPRVPSHFGWGEFQLRSRTCPISRSRSCSKLAMELAGECGFSEFLEEDRRRCSSKLPIVRE